jgi:hypothetical protein
MKLFYCVKRRRLFRSSLYFAVDNNHDFSLIATSSAVIITKSISIAQYVNYVNDMVHVQPKRLIKESTLSSDMR